LNTAAWGPFVRYAVCGLAAFLIDMAVTLLLAQVMHYILANTLGFVVANVIQFFLAHKWVFRRSFGDGRLWATYVATLSISLFGLLSSDAIVWVGVEWLALALPYAKFAATALTLLINYFLRKTLVYREP
jgi:putative flippase GtrA